ncbi:unnamed protein product [Rotaria magnacalcarata]|uniref:MULE transposase domain-containing protein n=3 Tax=Rotaria magnacalcarata TaxID=392030 RepID=A0A820ESD6_9BILA|nr:unnamed protein product [Rotaria magnacalcarata]
MAEALSDDDKSDSIDSVVPAYKEEATDDDSGESDIINSAKKIRASGLSYEKVNVFSDGKCAEEEAVNYNNFKWTCCKINDTEQGTKKYYKCNFKRGSNCPAKIYLLFHANNFEVTLFEAIIQHDHTTESEQIGIRIELKNVIVKLFQNGYTTPKAILSELDKLKIIQPKASQIASFLATLRKKLYGPAQISLNYIKNWCIEKSIVPNDPDECFVANYYIKDDDDDPLFILFVTTRNLIKNCLNSNHICADATYKLIWQGYPVLIVGTTDKQCAFHPFGIALCINEKTSDFDYCPIILVADASGAITNGFINVFNVVEKRIMCWFHIKKMKAELRRDIEFMQPIKNETIFDAAIKLFQQKWKAKECPPINNFIDYFINEWYMSNKGWFEGFTIGYPSSNNALEATNGTIKSLYTFRERLPVGEFLSVLENDIIHQLSRERNTDDPITSQNAKAFANVPSINLSLWTSTYHWIKEEREVIIMKNNDEKNAFY